MASDHVVEERLPEAQVWDKTRLADAAIQVDLDLTARCNNDCRHCYINLPAGDQEAKRRELSADEILAIAEEARALGTVWVMLSGGEPLLREDFADIYLALKKMGFLITLFTNATLVTEELAKLLGRYRPRDVEVTIYGVTAPTYEAVTRTPGSFARFKRGLDLLAAHGVRVRLKAMAMRSNLHELPEISRFGKERTKDYFRFDPQLHLRYDRNQARNQEIRSERLSAEELVAAERADPERFARLTSKCAEMMTRDGNHDGHGFCNHLIHCGAGKGSCTIGHDGTFRLCGSLVHPDCVYDLRKGTLTDAYRNFVPKVRDMRSDRPEFLNGCRRCNIPDFCLWCPAHAYLETGHLDMPVEFFCEVAHARVRAFGIDPNSPRSSST